MYQVNYQPYLIQPMFIHADEFATQEEAEEILERIRNELGGLYNGFTEPVNTGEHYFYGDYECRKI